MEPKTLSWLKSAVSAALAMFAFSLCPRHDTPDRPDPCATSRKVLTIAARCATAYAKQTRSNL
jgi:hypothetical protein